MGVRQYIGARYVIKVYENSQDPSSAEWEADVTYEPLTMVTYLNSSYLSKKDVPGSVGNPADNPSYWVVTGAYNGQIAALQHQIDNINIVIGDSSSGIIKDIADLGQDITDLETKLTSKLQGRRIVILTDSYGEAPAGSTFYDQLLASYPEFVDQDNIYMFAYGGRGFVSAGSGYDWESTFFGSSAYTTVTDRDTITDFFVLGGCNDAAENVSAGDITTAAQSLLTRIRTEFPNARVYCGFIGFSQNTAKLPWFTTMNSIYNQLVRYGYIPVGNGQNWFHYTGFLTDTVHPNASGARLIMSGLISAIYHTESSTPNYPNNVTKTGIGLIAAANNSPNPTIKSYKNGNIIGLYTENSIYMTFSTPQTIALNGTLYDLYDIEGTFIEGGNEWTNEQLIYAQIYDGTTTQNCFAYVKYYNNKLQVKFYATDASVTSINAESVFIGRFNFISNTSLM